MTAIQTEVSQKQRECEADLLKAEPALVAATAALNTLNRVRMVIFGFLRITLNVFIKSSPENMFIELRERR